MPINKITTTTPDVVPAGPAKTFDKVWITQLTVMSPNPNRKVSVNVMMRKAKADTRGTIDELTPRNPAGAISMKIDDLFSETDNDPALESAINTIIDKIGSMAQDQGLI